MHVIRAAPLLAALLLVLAGCGGGSKGSESTSTGTGSGKAVAADAVVDTSEGSFTIKLDVEHSPNTVASFEKLSRDGFYDGLTFHRIVPGFVIQGGDPKGDGTGGPGYKFHDEIGEDNKNDQYSLSMANSGPNTNGSQFFIVTAPKGAHWLDKKHTVFGKVIEGKDVVDKLNLTPVTGDKPDAPPKIVSAKVASKRNRTYKLEETAKVKDAPPQSINLGQGTYTPADIQKIKDDAAKKLSTPVTPPKTPEVKKNEPAKTPEQTKPADAPKTENKTETPAKPTDTKPADSKPPAAPQK